VPSLSPSPTAILALLRERTSEPATVSSIAEATGLHANTVREHLENLLDRGLVRRTRSRPRGRGRPAWHYDVPADSPPTSEYAGLAVTLAEALVQISASPEQAVAVAGEQWGRDLARARRDPEEPASATDARARTVAMLDALGFDPEVDPDAPDHVRLTRCPLLQAARRQPTVVCQAHLGLVRGALEEYGADPTGSRLLPFSEPGACRVVFPPLGSEPGG
jgi:predicted ArsR family transcriptional regulator